jgi:hypothetical protein
MNAAATKHESADLVKLIEVTLYFEVCGFPARSAGKPHTIGKYRAAAGKGVYAIVTHQND